MTSPVLFIIFKRYDTALQVFNAIRQARPPKLYIAADAPRENVNGEEEDCMKTRTIVDLVDWPCEVHTLFQKDNQGCGKGPFKAITWFFEKEEKGIVLEDDCVPNADFFSFCEAMLEKYNDDESISLITGRNMKGQFTVGDGSYFLSALHFCWGWASWRRVWNHYDYSLQNVTLSGYARHLFHIYGWNPMLIMWRLSIFFNCVFHPEMDVWDYQFAISTQNRETYTIVPCVNLVHNVGFDERATHTTCNNHTDIPSYPMSQLFHPATLQHSIEFDKSYVPVSNPVRFIAGFIKSCLKYIVRK